MWSNISAANNVSAGTWLSTRPGPKTWRRQGSKAVDSFLGLWKCQLKFEMWAATPSSMLQSTCSSAQNIFPYKNCHSLVSCVHWCTKIWYDFIQRYMEINQSMDRYLYYYLSHCHQVYTSRTLFSPNRYFAKRFYGPVLFAQWQTAKNLTMKVISNQICKSLVSHNTIFDISILRSPNVCRSSPFFSCILLS